MLALSVSLMVVAIALAIDGVHDLHHWQSPWPAWTASLSTGSLAIFFGVLYITEQSI
jgi:hypothetical protein